MADDTDVPIGDLLGAPVRAIQEAQIAAEREFVAFLLEYGFDRVQRTSGGRKEEVLALRNVEFRMKQAVPDPSSPGLSIEREATVTAPLLSLLNLPTVAIDEATIDLSLDVVIDQRSKSVGKVAAKPKGVAEKIMPQLARPAVQLKGVVGNRAVSHAFSAKGKLNVQIKLVSSRNSESVDRITQLFRDATSAVIKTEK
jgi:hypothetical protein